MTVNRKIGAVTAKGRSARPQSHDWDLLAHAADEPHEDKNRSYS